MNKTLSEIEFEDFLEASKAEINLRGDKDTIIGAFDEGTFEDGLISVCEEVYQEKIYNTGTLRGGVNAVVRILSQRVYESGRSSKMAERIDSGELLKHRGVVLGAYDREGQRKDGSGTFTKTFMPVICLDDGKIIEISTFGDKIGGDRYGKHIPYLKEASYVFDEDSYYSARMGMDISENKAVSVDDISDKEVDIEGLINLAENAGNYLDLEHLLDAIYNETIPSRPWVDITRDGVVTGRRKDVYHWVWFEGVVNRVTPSPVWEDGRRTDEQQFLYVPTRTSDNCFTFQVKSRGTLYDEVKHYPTVRLNSVNVAKTHVDWGKTKEWVYSLIDSEAINPETQLMSLNDQILGRKFYTLAKITSVSESYVDARGEGVPEGQKETIRFISLNAVFFALTDENIPWEPMDDSHTGDEPEEDPKTEDKPAPKKTTTKKAPASDKSSEKREALATEVKAYLSLFENATFEEMKAADVFENFPDIPDAALKKLVEKVKEEL